MFLSTAPYIYEVHTAHLPSASFEALSYVFYRAYATKNDFLILIFALMGRFDTLKVQNWT